jgi:hypothetical protein
MSRTDAQNGLDFHFNIGHELPKKTAYIIGHELPKKTAACPSFNKEVLLNLNVRNVYRLFTNNLRNSWHWEVPEVNWRQLPIVIQNVLCNFFYKNKHSQTWTI